MPRDLPSGFHLNPAPVSGYLAEYVDEGNTPGPTLRGLGQFRREQLGVVLQRGHAAARDGLAGFSGLLTRCGQGVRRGILRPPHRSQPLNPIDEVLTTSAAGSAISPRWFATTPSYPMPIAKRYRIISSPNIKSPAFPDHRPPSPCSPVPRTPRSFI